MKRLSPIFCGALFWYTKTMTISNLTMRFYLFIILFCLGQTSSAETLYFVGDNPELDKAMSMLNWCLKNKLKLKKESEDKSGIVTITMKCATSLQVIFNNYANSFQKGEIQRTIAKFTDTSLKSTLRSELKAALRNEKNLTLFFRDPTFSNLIRKKIESIYIHALADSSEDMFSLWEVQRAHFFWEELLKHYSQNNYDTNLISEIEQKRDFLFRKIQRIKNRYPYTSCHNISAFTEERYFSSILNFNYELEKEFESSRNQIINTKKCEGDLQLCLHANTISFTSKGINSESVEGLQVCLSGQTEDQPSFLYKRADARLATPVILDQTGYYSWFEKRDLNKTSPSLFFVRVSPDFVAGNRNSYLGQQEFFLGEIRNDKYKLVFETVERQWSLYSFPYKNKITFDFEGPNYLKVSDQKTMDLLERHLFDGHGEINLDTLREMIGIGPRALSQLKKYLYSDNRILRQNTASYLYQMGAPSIPVLINAWMDGNKDLWESINISLIQVGPKVIPYMEKTLLSRHYQEYYNSSEVLSRLGEKAVPLLIRGLKSTNPEIRLYSANALASIGAEAEDAVEQLIIAINDLHSQVRAQAIVSIGNIAKKKEVAIPALFKLALNLQEEIRGEASFALSSFEQDAVPTLINGLKNTDDQVRIFSAKTLSLIGKKAKMAIQALSKATQDKNQKVAEESVQALVRIGEEALPTLVTILGSKNDQVRAYAMVGIMEMRKKSVIHIKTVIRSTNIQLRQQAYHALERIGAHAAPATKELILGLQDKDGYVRYCAVRALANLKNDDPRVASALNRAAKSNDRHVRKVAKNTLKNWSKNNK